MNIEKLWQLIGIFLFSLATKNDYSQQTKTMNLKQLSGGILSASLALTIMVGCAEKAPKGTDVLNMRMVLG